DFPADAIEFLIQSLDITKDSYVLDLAAGTGKLTRRLVPTGARLTAMEPVEGMRRKFSALLPGVEILEGTAETIPLPVGQVDAVVVAQAFHWFNGPGALGEIHRVLKPGGKLGLVWNVRDESVDWIGQLSRIINAHEGNTPRYRTFEWKKAFDNTTLFTPLEKRSFRQVQTGNVEMVVDRTVSVSFIAALPEPARQKFVQEVRDLLSTHPQTKHLKEFEIPHSTEVYRCSRKE
ncbi:MAG TPA: class I SAM-dependent methyltransferase, partial [bacterium]|nr:class I SAM-dependent methyltransferase [bacterium]